MPKMIKVGGNLTKLVMTKTIVTVFLRHGID